MGDPVIVAAAASYRAILHLFPRAFRRRFGDEMTRSFAAGCAARRASRLRLAVYIAGALTDLAIGAAAERCATRQAPLAIDGEAAGCRPRSLGDSTMLDLRQTLRSFRKHPLGAAVIVATLTLGVGASVAMFATVHAVILEPLPYQAPDRLVIVWNRDSVEGKDHTPLSPANYFDIRQRTHTLERMEGFLDFFLNAIVSGTDTAERLSAFYVSPGLFDVLGRAPALGRSFEADDDTRPVVLLSDRYWRRRFGADAGAVGRTLTLDGQLTTIVGVMPADFVFPLRTMVGPDDFSAPGATDCWLPMPRARLTDDHGVYPRGVRSLGAIGRLKPGAGLAQASAEMATIAAQLRGDYPDANRNLDLVVTSLHEQSVGRARAALTLLGVGVCGLLLIACVNVANVLMARCAARREEFAMRAALGASRGRLLRQMLLEGALLGSIGGAGGLALAYAAVRVLVFTAPADIPRVTNVGIDIPVTLFGVAAAALASVLVAAGPAIMVAGAPLQIAHVRGGVGGRRRTRSVLAVVEIALALTLALASGLLIRSFERVLDTQPGFQPQHLLTMQLVLPNGYRTAPQRAAFYQQLASRLERLPGVQAIGGTTRLPLASSNVSTRVYVEGRRVAPGDEPDVEFRRAVLRYFTAMGVPLLQGRDFGEQDTADAPRVVILNETAARRLFPGESAVGHRVQTGPGPSTDGWSTVVGVVGDIHHASLEAAPAPELYIYYLQGPPVGPYMAIRTTGDIGMLAGAVRQELRSLDPQVAVLDLRPMEDVRSASVAPRRFIMGLTTLFGVLAVLLAAVGVYGVLTLDVQERTQEVGVRLALGARPRQVVALIARRAMLLCAAGGALGIVSALALAPLVRSQLFGISALDPTATAGTAVLLALVVAVATVAPARQMARVDPMRALHMD